MKRILKSGDTSVAVLDNLKWLFIALMFITLGALRASVCMLVHEDEK